jgi:hypothetical protein
MIKFSTFITELRQRGRPKYTAKFDANGNKRMRGATKTEREKGVPHTIDFSAASDFKYKGYDCSVVESGDTYKWYIYSGNRIMKSGDAETKEQAAIDCKKFCDED